MHIDVAKLSAVIAGFAVAVTSLVVAALVTRIIYRFCLNREHRGAYGPEYLVACTIFVLPGVTTMLRPGSLLYSIFYFVDAVPGIQSGVDGFTGTLAVIMGHMVWGSLTGWIIVACIELVRRQRRQMAPRSSTPTDT